MSIDFLPSNFLIDVFSGLLAFGFIFVMFLLLKLPGKKWFLRTLPLVLLILIWTSWNKSGPRITLEDEVKSRDQVQSSEIKSSKKFKTDEQRLQENQKLIDQNKID